MSKEAMKSDTYGQALLSAWDAVRDPGPAGDDVPHPVFVQGFSACWNALLTEQEPVAWVDGVEIYWHNAPDLNDWIRQNGQPLYTSPPARKPLTDDTCKWARPDSDHMPDTWEASCGAMWTFTEGGPKDNDMHFCLNCGKPAIEAARGIKE